MRCASGTTSAGPGETAFTTEYAEGAWRDAPPLAGFEHAGYACETPPLGTELRIVHCGAPVTTLRELRADPKIVSGSTAHDFRHGRHMFADAEFQSTHGWPDAGTYPEGAPEW